MKRNSYFAVLLRLFGIRTVVFIILMSVLWTGIGIARDLCLRLPVRGDCVVIPHCAAIDFKREFSIEFWGYLEETSDYLVILKRGDANRGYGINVDSKMIHGVVFGRYDTNCRTGPQLKRWSHLAVTYDGRTTRLYLDGRLMGSKSGQGPAMSTGTNLYVGATLNRDGSVREYYRGTYDELRIWNRALTERDLKDNMNRVLTGEETGLVAYYTFDELTDDGRIRDLSHNGNHAILVGRPEFLPSGAPITRPVTDVSVPAGELAANVIDSSLDVSIPATHVVNSDAIAVVIGNSDYSSDGVPDVQYAVRDALTVRNYLMKVLGYREGNILYFENVTGAVFRRLFGTKDVPEGQLAQYVKAGKSDVFIYYSGHGAPDVQNGSAYFVPVDCRPDDVRLNGYPLDLFYGNLAKIESRSTIVVIDACFSGGSEEGMLIKAASPIGIKTDDPASVIRNSAVFTSSSADQISSWYPEKGHGLFTYFFLKALRGEADADGDRVITAREIHSYLGDTTEGVPYWARRLHGGRNQSPTFQGNANLVVRSK